MQELQALAKYVEDFTLDQASPKVIAAAKECVLDTVGLALGARTNPMFQGIKNVYLEYGAPGTCPGKKDRLGNLWGSQDYTDLRTAVFLNAMMGHILELDDVHTTSKTHIGTVVIPAAWELARYHHRDGRSFLEAVICGYEVMSRIGMGFGVSSHRNKGWHVTCTAGTFGAAAACAKLLHFTTPQIMGAFGLAGTQSCGTWAFLSDGATNKILHPGRGSVSGLEACLLVLGGMRGSSHILDAKDGGIYPMMSDAYDYSLISKDLGRVYQLLEVDKKPYPCCRSTHCTIDATLALREAHQLTAEAVDKVLVKTYLVGLKQCGLTESSKIPTISTAAKFSTPFTVAKALLNGQVGLADFTPEAIADARTQELLRRVQVVEEPKFTKRYPAHWGCEVTIYTRDGRQFSKEIPDASGSVAAPLTPKQILSKVTACCQDYAVDWTQALFARLLELDKTPQLPSLDPQIRD